MRGGNTHRQSASSTAAHPAQGDSPAPPSSIGPASFFTCGEEQNWFFLGGRLATAVAALCLAVSVATAAVTEVGPIGLTVGNLDRQVEFFTTVLDFEKVSDEPAAGSEIAALTAIPNARTRTATLRLGDEFITLTEFLTPTGRPVPQDSRSHDHWFQHIAIVVSDMDRAYEHLRHHKVRHVSTAPQTLPEWNTNAGGIKAFYFRDPEDHVLEIIWFPPGKGDPKWQQRAAGILPADRRDNLKPASRDAGSTIFLGIDHTAIVVSDSDRSLAFYRDVLGMKVAGESENHGPEQERLNQVFGARLRITALRAPRGPGIEFLEYIAPPGGRPLPADARANDLVFWQTRLRVDRADLRLDRLRRDDVRFVSAGIVKSDDGSRAAIVRDPDAHALWIEETPASHAVSVRQPPP